MRPVSMYLALKAGNTSLLKCAQCGQLAEAYSITVTLALGLPRVMSSGATVVSILARAGLKATRLSMRPAAMIRRRDDVMTCSYSFRRIARGGSRPDPR